MAEQSIFDFIQQLVEEGQRGQDTSGDFAPHEERPWSSGFMGATPSPQAEMEDNSLSEENLLALKGAQENPGVRVYRPIARDTTGVEPNADWAARNPNPLADEGGPYLDGQGAPLGAADTFPPGTTRYGGPDMDTPYGKDEAPMAAHTNHLDWLAEQWRQVR